MANRTLRYSLAALIYASLLLTGCVKQIRSTVPDFAQAVELTSTNVQAAFDTVNGKYNDAEAIHYAVTYDGQTDPRRISTNWLQPDSMKVRRQVLQGLKQYASALNSLTGSNNADSLSKASTAIGTSLQSLSKSPEFSKFTKDLPSETSNIAATAVNALGTWLIEAKLKKDLPPLIEKMDPNIQTICKMLVQDIGTVDANETNPTGGSGLRQVLWIQYNRIIDAQNQYILHNQCSKEGPVNCFGPDARMVEIRKLPDLVQQQSAADQTLQQVQATIKQLGQAHTELVKAAETKQSLTADLSDLLAEAQVLNTYYNSLSSTK